MNVTVLVFAAVLTVALAAGQFYVPRAYYTIDAAGHESPPVPLRRLARSLNPYPYQPRGSTSANANANANAWDGDAKANANSSSGAGRGLISPKPQGVGSYSVPLRDGH